VRCFYCNSIKEAFRKYENLHINSEYCVKDIFRADEKFDWFFADDYEEKSRECIMVNCPNLTVENLKSVMPCEDFKSWINNCEHIEEII